MCLHGRRCGRAGSQSRWSDVTDWGTVSPLSSGSSTRSNRLLAAKNKGQFIQKPHAAFCGLGIDRETVLSSHLLPFAGCQSC